MKVIIAGGRNFEHYNLLKLKCNEILKNVEDVQIVSGGSKGADLLGERYAKEKHYLVKRFEANWEREGKAAGPIRNTEMAKYADCLIAFWDGKSPGTKNMIKEAKKYILAAHIRIIKYA